MIEKNVKSRIQNKHDIEANWAKAENFVPLIGEIIVYDIDENYDYERFKIGDGTTSVTGLPFADENVLEEIDKLNTTIEDIQKKSVGKNVGETSQYVDGVYITAGPYAEIFNNYSGNKATGDYSHAEGTNTKAVGKYSHAEGSNTKASGTSSHAEGASTTAASNYSHAEGSNTKAEGDYSHAEGCQTKTLDAGAHAEGLNTIAKGAYSHAEGYLSIATGQGAHAEGLYQTYPIKITGAANSTTYTLSENVNNKYIKPGALILYNDSFSSVYAYNPNTLTITIGPSLSSEDLNEQTVTLCFGAFGASAHSEGYNTIASANQSHAEGSSTAASGNAAHAEGYETTASAHAAHAEGYVTIASSAYQHAQGKYNIASPYSLAHIVGNGTADDARSNAHTLDWNGDAWYAGDVYVGSTSGTNKDNGSKKLATEEYVDSALENIDIEGLDDVLTVELEDTNIGTPNTINADSLGGRSADEFALKSDIENLPTESYDDTGLRGLISANATEIESLKNMVGDTSVSTQIEAAVDTKISSVIPAVSYEDNGKFLRVVDGAWAAVVLPNAEGVGF